MALNLIILGAPGAGKGTQAERFAADRRIPKISTGDILREAVHAGTELGRRAKAIMESGELVSDDVMIGVVRERLERPDVKGGFILDGFPRTVAQAQALDAIMQGRSPLIVIDIDVPEQELVRRLGSRLVCSNCASNATTPGESETLKCVKCGGTLVRRSDDNAAAVAERLMVYKRKTMPLLDYYRSRPTFCSIDGAQTPDRVFSLLATAVDAANRGAGVTR